MKHPNTPASILESLAEQRDETLHTVLNNWYPQPLLLEKIASHPNTPIPVLQKLRDFKRSLSIPEIAKRNLRERKHDK